MERGSIVAESRVKKLRRRLAGLIAGKDASVSLAAPGRTGEIELVTAEACNVDWAESRRGTRLTFLRRPAIAKSDKVFAMGSCFAVEIRRELFRRGFDVYPKYDEIKFDPATQKMGKMPARDNINHYDTFTIRQEFEMAFANRHYLPGDFLSVAAGARSPFANPGPHVWQDPYRKRIYGATLESLADLSAKIDDCIRDAIQCANVYVVTLGLSEVWKNNQNGLYINQAPGKNTSGQFEGFTFETSTYAQNLENVMRICELVKEHFPTRKVILTVSPVPLSRTYSGGDIVLANTESKSTLRAVAAEVIRRCDNAIYWPSFEIALARDLFEADGRHVRQDGINLIVGEFLKVHLKDQ